MKRFASFLLILTFLLSGCGGASSLGAGASSAVETGSAAETAVTETLVTEAVETEPPETEAPETEPVETVPPHSVFYLPEVSQEEMIRYFNEVVLDTEYSTGSGDASLVQKWVQPIYYRITGQPADGDLSILESFFEALNQVEGFPGLFPLDESRPVEDVTISFLDETSFNLAFSDFLHGEYADAAVRYWYGTDTNEINSARIGYRTDISGDTRASVLLEEVVNLLGFNDTTQRTDSIVYQYGSEVTQLSEVDWVLIRLLYHPDIRCGMDMDACREVLETLYY